MAGPNEIEDPDDGWTLYDSDAPRRGPDWLAVPEEGLIEVAVPVKGHPALVARWVFDVNTTPPIAISARVSQRRDSAAPVSVVSALRCCGSSVAKERLVRLLRDEDGLVELFGSRIDPVVVRQHRGQKGKDDAMYAELVCEYLDLVAMGVRAPARQLAERHHFAASEISNRLTEARNRGLLTRVGKGKVGGELTPKGRLALRKAGLI